MREHYFREYCLECNAVHWVEITPARRQVCHGRHYFPQNDATHFTRWKAGGIELIEKAPRALPLEWQMAEEAAAIHDDAFLDLGI